jgi:hypothetical protein
MNTRSSWFGNAKATAVIVLAILILLPVGYSIVAFVFARGTPDSEVFLEMPDAKYEQCVRETEYMRYHHWELLREVREEFVREGNRGEISLSGCRECHPNRERFCNQCHKAVSLYPDCWGCHYYPATPGAEEDEAHVNKGELYPRRMAVAAGEPAGG